MDVREVVRGIADPFVMAQFCGLPVHMLRGATVEVRDGVLFQPLERAPHEAEIAAAWIGFAGWLLESLGLEVSLDRVTYVVTEFAPALDLSIALPLARA